MVQSNLNISLFNKIPPCILYHKLPYHLKQSQNQVIDYIFRMLPALYELSIKHMRNKVFDKNSNELLL